MKPLQVNLFLAGLGHLSTKFVKLFDHTYVCSSLTNFEYEVNEMKWNERKWKWFKSAIIVWKNSWNHFRWTYFLRAITYVCSSLTNFEYEVKEMTGNGSDLNFLKLAGKNSWNHFEWTYVLQIWAITYVCSSSLTNFEYEVNEMTGNGNYLNLLKLAWE